MCSYFLRSEETAPPQQNRRRSSDAAQVDLAESRRIEVLILFGVYLHAY